jgi:hypothetical protein
MQKISRRVFNQVTTGTAASITLAFQGLRADEPPKLVEYFKIACHAEGIVNGMVRKSGTFSDDQIPTATACEEALGKLTKLAFADFEARYATKASVPVIEESTCPMFPPFPPIEEREFALGSGRMKPRWVAYVACDTCLGFPISGQGTGLTKIGALAKANCDLNERLGNIQHGKRIRCTGRRVRLVYRLPSIACCK